MNGSTESHGLEYFSLALSIFSVSFYTSLAFFQNRERHREYEENRFRVRGYTEPPQLR